MADTENDINLLYDPIFKAFSMSRVVKKKLSKVISKITGISYNDIYNSKFQGGPIPKQNKNEKGKESDLIIHVSDELIIIIEMNKFFREDLFKEKSDYALNCITRCTKENGKYTKVILINIDNFNAFNTTEPIVDCDIQSKKYIIENENYKSYHIILENIVNKEYNKNIDNEVIEFFSFLQIKTLEEMKEKYGKDEEYMKIVKKVEDIYNDPKWIGYYYPEDRQKMALDYARNKGIEIGEKNIMDKLLSKGYSKKELSELLDIPINKIKTLSK